VRVFILVVQFALIVTRSLHFPTLRTFLMASSQFLQPWGDAFSYLHTFAIIGFAENQAARINLSYPLVRKDTVELTEADTGIYLKYLAIPRCKVGGDVHEPDRVVVR